MSISILLRSNGAALACGYYFLGQCNIHSLDDYLTYMQLAGVNVRILRLRTDGWLWPVDSATLVHALYLRWMASVHSLSNVIHLHLVVNSHARK